MYSRSGYFTLHCNHAVNSVPDWYGCVVPDRVEPLFHKNYQPIMDCDICDILARCVTISNKVYLLFTTSANCHKLDNPMLLQVSNQRFRRKDWRNYCWSDFYLLHCLSRRLHDCNCCLSPFICKCILANRCKCANINTQLYFRLGEALREVW